MEKLEEVIDALARSDGWWGLRNVMTPTDLSEALEEALHAIEQLQLAAKLPVGKVDKPK